MARARNIKPGFFKNEYLAQCDALARLLFVGLWTLSDREGRLEWRPLRVKAELFPYENCDVEKLANQLQKFGFLEVYEAEDGVTYCEITAFTKHQNPHPSEKSQDYPAPTIKNNCKQFKNISNNADSLIPITDSPIPSNAPATNVAASKTNSITWDSVEGWQGITEGDRATWAEAYPAVIIDQELAKAADWLLSNPKKSRRYNWRKFLTNWFRSNQDKGGTRNGKQNAAPVPKSRRRYFRKEYHENLTDQEFDERQQGKRAPEVLQLAKKLTTKGD